MIKVIEDFLTQGECDLLLQESEGKYVSTVIPKKHYNTKVAGKNIYLNNITHYTKYSTTHFLYPKLKSAIESLGYKELNDKPYGGMSLLYPKGGFIFKHCDSEGNLNHRIESGVIFLNDEYVGGELLVYKDKSTPITIKNRKGTLCLFNSKLYHEVTPVIKGERKTLALFF
jgi:Rps23 Pro-64 3,4-dihydroxylase Tpa1-like proline 4-hydroxylase